MSDRDAFPRDISNGNGGATGYTVEARYISPHGPKKIGDLILHSDWTPVKYANGECGVPIHSNELGRHGLLSWPAANAIRWWFIASLDYHASGVETRIVEHSLVTSHKVTALRARSEEMYDGVWPRGTT